MKILILQSSLKKTSEECRNSVRAREGLPRQAKQICFPDISIVPIAVLSSITALPTSLRRQDFFCCANYRSNKGTCSAHYIRAVVLEQIVLKAVNETLELVKCHEKEFRDNYHSRQKSLKDEEIKALKKDISSAEKRLSELGNLFRKIYEDNASGKISDEEFEPLANSYRKEQSDLQSKLTISRKKLEAQETNADKINTFISKAKGYTELEKVTPKALSDLVNRIIVSAPEKVDGHRTQKVKVIFTCDDLV